MPVGMIVGISGLVLLLSSERELKARVSWSILGIWEGFEVSVDVSSMCKGDYERFVYDILMGKWTRLRLLRSETCVRPQDSLERACLSVETGSKVDQSAYVQHQAWPSKENESFLMVDFS